MGLQTDIEWITEEIKNVKDPDLIEALKSMLRFRRKTQSPSIDDYNRDIELAEEDIKQGRVYTQDQIRSLRDQWKNEL